MGRLVAAPHNELHSSRKSGERGLRSNCRKAAPSRGRIGFPQPTSRFALAWILCKRTRASPLAKQILSKAKIVTLSPAELAARQVEPRHTEVDGLDHDVTVMVDVIVGIDGHVWKATAKNPPTERIGRDASNEAIAITYRPVRVNGAPCKCQARPRVTLYASPSRAAAPAP